MLAVFIIFGFLTNESSDTTPTTAEKTKIAGEKNQLNDLPTATAVAGANPSPAESVVIGDLDWTKDQTNKNQVNILENYKFNSADEEARIKSNDPCAIAGLDDNWSDPFEKTMCGMTRFIGRQIIEPMNQMACNFSGAALASNYGSHIDAKFVDQKCYILDRK